jgi:hypothetical protein
MHSYFQVENLHPFCHTIAVVVQNDLRDPSMAQRDPAVADRAPSANTVTDYDKDHLVIYLRLLDADADGADWIDVARIVLNIDPEREPERARTAWESHLERAKWVTSHGYKDLVRGDGSH